MDGTLTLEKLRRGERDLVTYVGELCDRIEADEPDLHALVPGTYERRRVLAEASELQHRFPNPAGRPPLYGVPIGVKDIFRVDGFPTRCGAELPPELFAGPEAPCVTALKGAGALIVGKTVTTEFAYFEPGPTRNPHNPAHTPGGSSSGSAAGVARGFFPLALGTQTIGSVIRPAAFCGIVGFKPSYGRVSTAGVVPFSATADHVGVFSQGVGGVALAMPVLDPSWTPADEKEAAPTLGVPDGPYLDQASANGRRHFASRLERLAGAGCRVTVAPALRNIAEINQDHLTLIAAEVSRVHARWFAEYRDRYRPKTVEIIERGRRVADAELERVRAASRSFREATQRRMDDAGIDYWVCAAATDHAPAGLAGTGSPLMNLPWTHGGLPAITLPAGRDDSGLPHGVQLVARYGADEALIEAGRVLETAISAA